MPKRIIAAGAILLFSATLLLSFAMLGACHETSHVAIGIATSGSTCSFSGVLAHLTAWQATFLAFVLTLIVTVAGSIVAVAGIATFVSPDASTVRARERSARHRLHPSPNMKAFDPLLEYFRRGIVEDRRSAKGSIV